MMENEDIKITDAMADSYVSSLVNKLFKILPLKEENSDTLCAYLKSLQRELCGFNKIVNGSDCAYIVSIMSVLQYLIDHDESDVGVVRSEVFRAISLCKKIRFKKGASV